MLETVARVRALNPDAVYCCDPVMGDVGRGMFVLPGVPELIRDRVVPMADIVTPNAFELAYLAGVELDEIDTLPGLLAAVDRVRATGPSTVLVTSVTVPVASLAPTTTPVASLAPTTTPVASLAPTTTPESETTEEIAMLAVDPTGAYLVRTPRLPISVNGAGDVTAALFLAHLTDGVQIALAKVASSVHAILRRTVEAGAREIQLIQAQDEIASPPCEFPVIKLS